MKLLHLIFVVFALAWLVFSIRLVDQRIENHQRFGMEKDFSSLKTENLR